MPLPSVHSYLRFPPPLQLPVEVTDPSRKSSRELRAGSSGQHSQLSCRSDEINSQRIAEELGVRERQVEAAISLLDGGATVPFIARYRKEATGTLDDTQLRTLEERLRYLRELEERRAAILGSIRDQGKLDDALRQAIEAADSKARLEDIYLPYKPKRRTKARSLEKLASSRLPTCFLPIPSGIRARQPPHSSARSTR